MRAGARLYSGLPSDIGVPNLGETPKSTRGRHGAQTFRRAVASPCKGLVSGEECPSTATFRDKHQGAGGESNVLACWDRSVSSGPS
jgi:hypothetical protein